MRGISFFPKCYQDGIDLQKHILSVLLAWQLISPSIQFEPAVNHSEAVQMPHLSTYM